MFARTRTQTILLRGELLRSTPVTLVRASFFVDSRSFVPKYDHNVRAPPPYRRRRGPDARPATGSGRRGASCTSARARTGEISSVSAAVVGGAGTARAEEAFLAVRLGGPAASAEAPWPPEGQRHRRREGIGVPRKVHRLLTSSRTFDAIKKENVYELNL